MSTLLRKLTVKSVGCKPDFEALLAAPDKRMKLCRFYGIARKAKPDNSDFGDFVRFTGSFRGVNLADGEIYEAGALILPGVAQDLLAGALDNEEVSDVQFAFEIGLKYDATVVTKYTYTVESLIKAAENDPLQMLEKQMLLQLAAPAPGQNAAAEHHASGEPKKSAKK